MSWLPRVPRCRKQKKYSFFILCFKEKRKRKNEKQKWACRVAGIDKVFRTTEQEDRRREPLHAQIHTQIRTLMPSLTKTQVSCAANKQDKGTRENRNGFVETHCTCSCSSNNNRGGKPQRSSGEALFVLLNAFPSLLYVYVDA